eukprot:Gb_14688 [translate_table: standard]
MYYQIWTTLSLKSSHGTLDVSLHGSEALVCRPPHLSSLISQRVRNNEVPTLYIFLSSKGC